LISESTLAPDQDSSAASEFLCRITGTSSIEGLQDQLEARTKRAADVINGVLPDVKEEE
jgi:hypothetical protein